MSQVYDLLDFIVVLFGRWVPIAEEPAVSIFKAESGRLLVPVYHVAWYYITQDHDLHVYRRENLRSHMSV